MMPRSHLTMTHRESSRRAICNWHDGVNKADERHKVPGQSEDL